MESKANSLLSQLPSVETIKAQEGFRALLEKYSEAFLTMVVRRVLDEARQGLLQGKLSQVPEPEEVCQRLREEVERQVRSSFPRVINATGIVLHTNLGRAILCEEAIEALVECASRFTALELDLKSGKRGPRAKGVESLLCQLTGAEAATVVNNNAAAVMLALDTLAKEREVIVSRGQLIEIGGGFRIPEVMEKSGSRLIEVGTTNKTYLRDYEKAINERTAMLLMVHPSNYRIIGFTAEVEAAELVSLARRHGLLVMEDLGSGALWDFTRAGLPKEPMAQEAIKAGVDVVTFSSDKLLGGPQGGVILAKAGLMEKMKKNPLFRALRMDKLCMAALEATLRVYFTSKDVAQEVPTLRMISMSQEKIRERAENLYKALKDELADTFDLWLEDGFSQAGGGSMPEENIPTCLIAMKPREGSLESITERLRLSSPPILGRMKNDYLLFDLRTVQEDEEELLLQALLRLRDLL